MIIISNSREILDDWDSSTLKDFRVTNSRPLKDKGRGIRTSRKDHQLFGLHSSRRCIAGIQKFGIGHELRIGLILYSDSSFVIIEENFHDLLFYQDVEVGIVSAAHLRVKISVGRILPPPVRTNVSLVAFYAVVVIEILQIFVLRISKLACSFDEGILGTFGCVSTFGYIGRTSVAVVLPFALAMVRFQLDSGQICSA